MDNTPDATRISSENNNILGKESSSPFESSNKNPFIKARGRNRNLTSPFEATNKYVFRGASRKEHKPPKEIEIVPNYEKFNLCMCFMVNNMFNKHHGGIVINRLKGKISESVFNTNTQILDERKEALWNSINISRRTHCGFAELQSGTLSESTITRIVDAFAAFPLVPKKENQKANLRTKICDRFEAQGFIVARGDPRSELTDKIKDMPLEQISQILSTI